MLVHRVLGFWLVCARKQNIIYDLSFTDVVSSGVQPINVSNVNSARDIETNKYRS